MTQKPFAVDSMSADRSPPDPDAKKHPVSGVRRGGFDALAKLKALEDSELRLSVMRAASEQARAQVGLHAASTSKLQTATGTKHPFSAAVQDPNTGDFVDPQDSPAETLSRYADTVTKKLREVETQLARAPFRTAHELPYLDRHWTIGFGRHGSHWRLLYWRKDWNSPNGKEQPLDSVDIVARATAALMLPDLIQNMRQSFESQKTQLELAIRSLEVTQRLLGKEGL